MWNDPDQQDADQVTGRDQRDDSLSYVLDRRDLAADQGKQNAQPQRHQPPAVGRHQQRCRADDQGGLAEIDFLLAAPDRLPQEKASEVKQQKRLRDRRVDPEGQSHVQSEQHQRQPILLPYSQQTTHQQRRARRPGGIHAV